ncbi:MAG: DUF2235 domain-containing protein [Sulfuricella sp.]|nr:DUF2235 domain-containing protein [Sulfuricella sp.]
MRNLVVCCDGTWNAPEDMKSGVPVPTNVVRLYNALADADAQGNPQIGYYHPGVGTEGGPLKRLWEGGVGAGLDRNIMSAYRWLAAHYRTGDRLFLFGFSRGAFTVRSLGGMMSVCGLLDLSGLDDGETWRRVEAAYREGYRRRKGNWAGDWAFHGGNGTGGTVPIHFLGVWDTVGALGIPDDLGVLDLLDFPSRYRFHHTELGKNVLNARHAVALDEKRASFTPTLWTAQEGCSSVKQTWFPGVHCDVGGGYAQKGLADGALRWMMDEAAALGLALWPAMIDQLRPDFRDVLHDSAAGVFKLFRTQPRSVPLLTDQAALHASALERRVAPPIAQAPYRLSFRLAPGEEKTLPIFAAQHWNDTGIYLEAGARYAFKASGEWLDSTIKCGPGGPKAGFQPGKAAYSLASLWGLGVKLVRMLPRLQGTKFGMRREENMPWFALVGAIANGGNPKLDGTPLPHETFLVGEACEYPAAGAKLAQPGYLYCFANDLWGMYGNNRGQVTLTVRRLE